MAEPPPVGPLTVPVLVNVPAMDTDPLPPVNVPELAQVPPTLMVPLPAVKVPILGAFPVTVTDSAFQAAAPLFVNIPPTVVFAGEALPFIVPVALLVRFPVIPNVPVPWLIVVAFVHE